MKNGVNIAGLSETAHEIRAKPAEAQVVYRGTASWSSRGLLQARAERCTLGTSRAARNFLIHCATGARATDAEVASELVTPMELALMGVGACLLVTVVLGASSRGHSLVDASMLLAPAEPGSPWAFEYNLAAHGDMKPEALIDTLQVAARRSPSHRTLVERNTVACAIEEPSARAARASDIFQGARDVAVAPEEWPFAGDRRRLAARRHVTLRWDYGMQLSAWPSSEDARRSRFPVDQPKQFGGMDRGPNPQEYLLSGLAASVAETAATIARARDLNVHEVTCRFHGRVDLHGFLGVDARVPDKIQDISCTLAFRGTGTPEQHAAIAQEAVETAEVARFLARANPARLALFRNGEQLHELTCAEA